MQGLLVLAAVASAAPSRAGVNITWAEFTDATCKFPLGTPAPSLEPLRECGVVPQADPNGMWRGSSFQFDSCTAARGGPAVAAYSAYSDGGCETWFTNCAETCHSSCAASASVLLLLTRRCRWLSVQGRSL